MKVSILTASRVSIRIAVCRVRLGLASQPVVCFYLVWLYTQLRAKLAVCIASANPNSPNANPNPNHCLTLTCRLALTLVYPNPKPDPPELSFEIVVDKIYNTDNSMY